MFEIQKGIPIPESRGRRGRPNTYPFAAMKVGDSFSVPVEPGRPIAYVQKSIRAAALSFAKRHGNVGHEYVTRSLREDGNLAVRIWRTA